MLCTRAEKHLEWTKERHVQVGGGRQRRSEGSSADGRGGSVEEESDGASSARVARLARSSSCNLVFRLLVTGTDEVVEKRAGTSFGVLVLLAGLFNVTVEVTGRLFVNVRVVVEVVFWKGSVDGH